MGELYLTSIHYIFGQEAGFSSKAAIITEILRTDSWQEEENHPLLRHKSCSSTKQHNSHVPALSQQGRKKQRGALCNKPSSRLPRATSNIYSEEMSLSGLCHISEGNSRSCCYICVRLVRTSSTIFSKTLNFIGALSRDWSRHHCKTKGIQVVCTIGWFTSSGKMRKNSLWSKIHKAVDRKWCSETNLPLFPLPPPSDENI